VKRRDLLCRLGVVGIAGLSGCSVSLGRSTESDSSLWATPSEKTMTLGAGPHRRRISLVEQDQVPAKYDMDLDVEVLQPTVTEEHPARLRVTVANEGEARRLEPASADCGPLRHENTGSDPSGLWLTIPWSNHLPTAAANATTTEAYLVGIGGPPWTTSKRVFVSAECLGPEYDPGESRSVDYAVLDDRAVDGYYLPGEYRFQAEISTPGGDFTWGFRLDVDVLPEGQ
jgi:hypothetical protein